MHLLLEGTDLQQLLTQVRETHGESARVVRAERIRSGGVAGFFSKERYEVSVEMDHSEGRAATADEGLAAAADEGRTEVHPMSGLQSGAGNAEVESVNDEGRTGDAQPEAAGETREALDFEALLAAADLAESRSRGEQDAPVTGQDTASRPAPSEQAADDFEAARRGLVDMLTASGAVDSARASGLLAEGADDQLDEGDHAGDETHDEADHYEAQHAALGPVVDLAAALADLGARQEQERLAAEFERQQAQRAADAEALAEADRLAEEELLDEARRELERAEIEAAQHEEAERQEAQRQEAERWEAQRQEAQRQEAERQEAQRQEAERQEAQRQEAEQQEAQRQEASRREARAREEQRMRQQELERLELERAAAVRAEERHREEARAQVRRRQAERVQRPASPQSGAERSLGEILAAADAADGNNRLGAMFSAGRQPQAVPAARREPEPARTTPHRPISTESESFSRTIASMRSSAGAQPPAGRTPDTAVTTDVRSVSRQSLRPERPRPGRSSAAGDESRSAGRFDVQANRTPEDRVSDQFGAMNGAASRRPEHLDVPHEGRENPFAGRGERVSRRPELRRPAVDDHFGDRFGDRAEVEDGRVFADEDHGYAEEPRRGLAAVEAFAEADFAGESRAGEGYGTGAYGRGTQRTEDRNNGAGERAGYDGDDNEAGTMDQTYRDAVTTYSDRSAAAPRAPYREAQDSTDVLRLARDIEIPAPLRVGSGELVIVVGEADAVVATALLVADEVGSEAPLVLGRADVQNTITADELPARQEQARRWSAPLTIAIPARPTAADAERAARVAAEVGAASVVVCVDATRRSHSVAALLRALDANGVPARRLAVHRAAESPDPLDVLSLDVPVGFLDGRPATSGAWAGLLLDATSEQHGAR